MLAAFTAGDLVVLQTDGASTATNTTVTIIELNPALTNQTAVNSVAISGSGANALRINSNPSTTGYLSLSGDGSLLAFAGHNTAATGGNVNNTLPRGVGTLGVDSTFTLATTYTASAAGQARGATSLNNSTWFIADSTGIYSNGTNAPDPAATSYRSLKVFGGVTYALQAVATATAVSTISAATGGIVTSLPGLPASSAQAKDFYFVSSGVNGATYDVLYVLFASSATAGTIRKYSLDTGTWVANGTYTTTFGGFGIVAASNGTGADLFVTSGAGNTADNTVIGLVDQAGFNQTIDIASSRVLYTVPSGTNVKGIDFAPNDATVINNGVASINYNAGDAAAIVSGAVTLTDRSASYNGSRLTVSISSGEAIDQLSITNQGTGVGQIGTSAGNVVTYGGASIGTFSGGTSGDPLVVNLSSVNASKTAVQALVNQIRFRTTTTNATAKSPVIQFQIVEPGVVNPASNISAVTISINNVPVLATNTGLAAATGIATPITSAQLQVADLDQTAAALTYTITSSPAHGQIRIDGAPTTSFTQADIDASRISYFSNDGATSDTFSFTVTDGAGGFLGTQLFSINIALGALPVLTTNTGLTLAEGATATIGNGTLLVSDIDSSAAQLRFTVVASPVNGTLFRNGIALATSSNFTQADINNGLITYAHNDTETTSDSFLFSVSDGAGGAILTTPFGFTITPVNDAPVANADTVANSVEDTEFIISLTQLLANDLPGPLPEAGQNLTITSVGSPVGGSVFLISGGIRFVPTANYSGSAGFSYVMSDDGTTAGQPDPKSATGTVSFVITETNDLPIAVADQLPTVAEGNGAITVAAFLLTSNDSAGQADEVAQTLTLTSVFNAIGGVVSLSSGNVIFTPDQDFFGTASFNYTVQDNGTNAGVGDPRSTIGTVNIVVTEVNDPPVALDDSLSLIAKNAVARTIAISSLIGNDSPGPNETAQQLTITSVSNPIGGSVAIVGANVVFSPTPDFVGTASFDYTVADNGTTNGTSDSKTDIGSVQFSVLDVSTIVDFAQSSSAIAESAGSVSLVAVLNSAPSSSVVIPIRVSGTVTGADFSIGGSSLTFLAGQTSAALTVSIVNDLLDENDESVIIAFDLSADAQLGTTSVHTLTIVDDDAPPIANFAIASQNRDESVGTVNIVATLAGPSGRDVTLLFNASGNADSQDFTLAQSTVVIPAGQLTAAIPVTVVDDSSSESLETVTLTLQASTTAIPGTNASHTLTIVDNDVSPVVQFVSTSQSVNEAYGSAVVWVTLSQELSNDVVIPLIVTGTASANDFSIDGSTIVIPGGQTSAAITISLVNDPRDEWNETVTIALGNPAHAQLGSDSSHTLVIIDNDPTPLVQFTTPSQSATEAAGTVKVVLRLSQLSDRDVSVPYIIDGTADSADVSNPTPIPNNSSAWAYIPAGQLTTAIDVVILDDSLAESTESLIFSVSTPTNAISGAVNSQTLSIVDNDSLATAQFITDSFNVSEAVGSVVLSLGLSSIALTDTTIPLFLSGTANGSDYALSTTSVTIPAGETRASFIVNVNDDSIDEFAETLTISLGSPIGATLGTNTAATLTIDDNDPVISFVRGTDRSVDENGVITVIARTLSPVISDLVVPFNAFGSATNGADYSLSANAFQFLVGSSTAAIAITITDDTTVEPNEAITLQLLPPPNTSLGSSGLYTLFVSDNDSVVTPGLDLNGRDTGQDYVNPAGEFVEDGAAVVLTPNATVSPPGLQTLNAITVYLESAPNGVAESLAAVSSGGATASTYNPTTRTLSITGGTVSDIQAVLRAVTYQNVSQNPASGSRFITFTASYSGGTESRRRKIVVTPVDDQPVIVNSVGTTTFVTGSSPVTIDSGIILADVESNQLIRAVVTLTDPELGDVLTLPFTGGFASSVVGNVLMVTPTAGTASLAGFRIALSRVSFATTTIGDGLRTIAFSVTDISGLVGVAGATSATANKTIAVQSPLLIARDNSPSVPSSYESLTSAQLKPIVTEAIARWETAGATSSQLVLLGAATIEIRDIGDQQTLGLGGGSTIVLDDNAAGYGWFVDGTPSADEEFSVDAALGESHAVASQAIVRVDLLTVVMHEFGHLLGLDDGFEDTSYSTMSDSLAYSTRRTLKNTELSTYFARLGDQFAS